MTLIIMLLGVAPAAADSQQPEVPKKPVLVGTTPSSIELLLLDNGDDVGVVAYELSHNTVDDFATASRTIVNRSGVETVHLDTGVAPISEHYYWLKARDAAGNWSYRSGELKVVPEEYATAELGGRWELIRRADPTSPVALNAINIRGDRIASATLDHADIDNLASRFDTIRLSVAWREAQPSQGASVATHLDGPVLSLIVAAEQAGVGIILDPLHLVGPDFAIPDWAWTNAGYPGHHPDDSFEVLEHPHPTTGRTQGGQYLREVLQWVGAHEQAGTFNNIVSFEVVNEPHPPNGNAYENTHLIVDLQAQWVADLRLIDPDKPFVLSGYYGGTLDKIEDVSKTCPVASPPSCLLNPDGSSKWPNLIWTSHDYYTGIPKSSDASIDTDADGFGDIDHPTEWLRGSKRGVRVESYSARVCYGYESHSGLGGTGAFTCTAPSSAIRAGARQNVIAGIEAQDGVAQSANMPLFVGEWGAHPYRFLPNLSSWAGVGHAEELICDHLVAYRSLGVPGQDAWSAPNANFDSVSWAVWNFDSRVDGYGIYNAGTNSWIDSGPNAGGVAKPFIDDSCTGSAQPAVTCNGLAVTVDIGAGEAATSGNDVILGTPGSDTIDGLNGSDTICGLGGDDVINGGSGSDLIFAGGGNDTVDGGVASDVIHGGSGSDVLAGGSGNDYLHGEGQNDEIDGGQGVDRIWGGGGDDVLRGDDGNDYLYGQAGLDELRGGVGVDRLFGGSNDDRLYGDDDGDLMWGGSGADQVSGGDGNDIVWGGAGSDVVFGGAGADLIRGGNGDDAIYAGADDDLVSSGAGNDVVRGSSGFDQMFGGSGDDDLHGGSGDDVLNGQSGVDVLNGSSGVDSCTGASGLGETMTGCESPAGAALDVPDWVDTE